MKRWCMMMMPAILAVALLLGLAVSLFSSAAAAELLRPTDVTPIGTARAAGAGWSGSLQGNVTVPPGVYRNNTFAIQDATGGIYIYVSGVTIPSMALGDVVQVTGTIKNYNGLLEIDPVTAIVRHNSGTTPDPKVVSTAAVDANQGWLIQVTGTVTWTTPPPTAGASDWSCYINDGSGLVQVFVDKDTGIDMTGYTSPTQLTIIGFSGNYNRAQIMPRYQSDITVPDTTPPTVTATAPTSNATGVSLYDSLTATFSEKLAPATVTTATFTLEGPTGAVAGTVSYDSGTRTATLDPTAALAALSRYTATLSAGITDLAGNPLVPYSWSFTTGLADTTPPTLTGYAPTDGATGISLAAQVVMTFSEALDPASVTSATVFLTGPGGAVPATLAYTPGATRVTLRPSGQLAPTTRYTATVKATVSDVAGNPLGSDTVWSFTTAAEAPFLAYHGDIHNHTSASDGSGTAAQALAAGKAAGFDFMAITDHSYAIDDSEWASILTAVHNATVDGEFVALRGFEYTQGAEGHINVYNTTRHAVRTNTGCASCDYTPNLEKGQTVDGFYHWVEVTGTLALDEAGTVMQFNHPGWINFNDWTYHPEVSNTARLEEVGNGNGTSYVFSEEEYIRSLDYGWKVGATNNADTHSPDWGVNTPHRTGVWMQALTKSDLLAALRARRTFATEDSNYELYLKGNGAWMGTELENTGTLSFEIYGADPDGEGTTVVQLITFGGAVVTETHPAGTTFTWRPTVAVTPGAHYYYVKAVQPDGDRIVSSPIWTTGAVDISLTDLKAEPTIATIFNPSLITARVTNRTAMTQTITVTFQVNGSPVGVVTTTAPACVYGPCSDGSAYISWQPLVTGSVTITAVLSGTPVGDNLEDNSRTIYMNVTDEKIPLVLIDNGHNNIAATPRDVRLFMEDLTAHGYNVLLNLDTLTAADLNTETVKLLVINAFGPDPLSDAELQAVADFVAAGGSLWLNGLADYTGKVAWAGTSANRLNQLLAAIETTTAYTIPMRMNSDEVLDGNDNNGYPWGVLWHNFPVSLTTGVGVNVVKIQSWSGCSLVDRNGQALTQSDLGSDGFIMVLGDEDTGTGTYGEANRTHNEDSDTTVTAFLYNTVTLPGGAGYDVPGAGGRIFLYNDANDPYNIFSYTAGDGKQNEVFNLEVTMWLLGEPLHKSTIAEARAYSTPNQPTHLDELVWIEGRITAAFGEFFNVLYVQDETGGITIHAPAGDIDAANYARGAYVRAVGTVGIYQGDTEVEFFEAEQVQVLTPTTGVDPLPLPMTTYSASLESNQGWLTQITGTVTALGGESIIINDGSGPMRAFLDGYNGTWADVQLFDRVTVKGLVSEDGSGPRIRVRNHGMHVGVPDDVTILARGLRIYLPLVLRNRQ